MWDRFDDAMDDIDDEKRELRQEAEKIVAKLKRRKRKVAIPPSPDDPAWPSGNDGDYMNKAYQSNMGSLNEWRAYVDQLRALADRKKR